jgi:hypothetical protein
MISVPTGKPGIRVSDSFRELSKDCWDDRGEVVMTTAAQAALSLAGSEAARAAGLDTVLGVHRGKRLIVKGPDGDQKQLHRNVMYGLAPWGRDGQAAAEMVKAIAVKHGPGKLWSTLAIVHPIQYDGMMRVADIGGVPHVYLRAIYFHEPAGLMTAIPRITSQSGLAIALRHLLVERGHVYAVAGHAPLKPNEVRVENAPIDPMDVEYDGVDLCTLLVEDRSMREDRPGVANRVRTPAQRAAVSAHWSAQLRAKVSASKAADAEIERNQVQIPLDAEDCEW